MWKQFFFCMFMYMRATLGVLCVCVCVVYVVVAVALDRCEFPEISITHGRKKKTVAKEHHHLVVASNQESARGGKGRERERWEKSNNKKQQQQRAVCACFSFVLWIHEQQHSHFLYAGLKRNGSNEFNMYSYDRFVYVYSMLCWDMGKWNARGREKRGFIYPLLRCVSPLLRFSYIGYAHTHAAIMLNMLNISTAHSVFVRFFVLPSVSFILPFSCSPSLAPCRISPILLLLGTLCLPFARHSRIPLWLVSASAVMVNTEHAQRYL